MIRSILSLSLAFLLIFSTVNAQNDNFGISIDCVNGCQDKEIDYDSDILFEFSVINQLDRWVKLSDEDSFNRLTLLIESRNLKERAQNVFFTNILGIPVIIAPQSEKKVYITLNLYNELKNDDRLGRWTITPTLSYSPQAISFHSDPYTSNSERASKEKIGFPTGNEIKGNVLEFKVIKPEPEVSKSIIPEALTNNPIVKWLFDYIFYIIGTIIATVVGYKIINRKKKRKK